MTKMAPFRVGQWLPSDEEFLRRWLAERAAAVESRPPEPLHRAVDALRQLIDSDPAVGMLFHLMLQEDKHTWSPTHQPEVKSVDTLLRLLNQVMTHAPEFNATGLVGFPINAILDWAMGTEAGFALFLNEKVNAHLKVLLNDWAVFLSSPDSRSVLNTSESGWFGPEAMKAMPDFDDEFVCDPDAPHRGFRSWDDFFTRQFRPDVRPVAEPDNTSVIVNACESAPYRICRKVKRYDDFWVKGQPYSVDHMLAGDPAVEKFVGGTIYQAFLSAFSYHRWHSPVDGRVVRAYVKEGTYYSEPPAFRFDPAGPNESQGYLAEVATRAIILIEADNPDIGLVGVLPIGMAEVSTCEITVYEGQHVSKGEQIGMFHFGGSTHCLMFGEDVNLEFHLGGRTPGLHSDNIPVNAKLATASRSRT